MSKKQTAVEWLIEHLTEYGFDLSAHKLEIDQAKAMEKEQIIEAFQNGHTAVINSEEYYTKTYGTNT